MFVLDPHLQAKAPKRAAFLRANLQALDRALRERGSALVVRTGEAAEVLARLVRETGAGAVYAHAEVSPLGRRREARVAERVPLRLVGWPTVHPPDAVRTADGGGYTVFGRFRSRLLSLDLTAHPLPAPSRLAPHPVPPGRLPGTYAAAGGEAEALHLLRRFAEEAMAQYHRDRNRLDRDATSRLSPYLRFGVLSPLVAYRTALQVAAAPGGGARQGAEAWRDELLWREFFAHLLYHLPRTRREPLRKRFAGLRWDNDEERFRAWCEGRTGYPVVDAAMRELAQTGWIHNRARMVVASFLVKNLLVDWRWGERHFMEHLVDGDPASNGGNWQWVAGVGADAAPYFRVFNPVLQGQRWDPQGAYVRRWVPEVARVPAPYVHAPWTLPRDDQVAYRCRVGRDYPAPVVDFAASRRRAVERFARALQDGRGGAV